MVCAVFSKLPMRQLTKRAWCAQFDSKCDYPGAHIWQYTESENIEGKLFDADVVMEG